MSIVKGLNAINKYVDDQEKKYQARQEGGTGTKAEWFKLADKQQVKVLFLQELDDGSENYSEKNGLGFLAVEHVSPQNFRNKALCTADEGECYGCEMRQEDWQGWKQKTRLYINALVDDGNETKVVVLSQGNGPKSITPLLLEYATEDGTITDKWFKIKRTGSGPTDTSYTLMSSTKSTEDIESFELFDLEKVVRNVPYEKQEAHYGYAPNTEEKKEAPKVAVAAGASTSDQDW